MQVRVVPCVDMDLKAHTFVFQGKSADSAAFGKARRLTNHENRQTLDGLYDFIDVRFFRCADEQNFAVFQVLKIFPPFIALDDKSPWPNFLVFHKAIENTSEGIRP